MIDVDVKWNVGDTVIIQLPYNRREIGKITEIGKEAVHVMFNDHVIKVGLDGRDLNPFHCRSAGAIAIMHPNSGELKEIRLENKRKKLGQIDFSLLTEEQVNGIVKEMKRLGVKF